MKDLRRIMFCMYFRRSVQKLQMIPFRMYSNIYGIQDIVYQEKPLNFKIHPVKSENHDMVIDLIKKYYMKEHVLVRSRNIDLTEDQAITEYIARLLRQGTSLYIKSEDGRTAGVCVNFAASQVDPPNLRNYAYYRQDPNAKDFLNFTAKLQETPNLWTIFKQIKIFEIKMLTILPEFRRQGLAAMLTEKSIAQAEDLGYRVVRMNCINDYDYKIAERCMMRYLAEFPLHKLRSSTAPFIKRDSDYNTYVRVYVHAPAQCDAHAHLKPRDLEDMIE